MFVALSQTARLWYGMAAAPNGDIYACVTGGDIYKQTGGVGNFIALSQTVRGWYGMAAAPNGDIYAAVYNSDIYKQTGGVGDFVALSQTVRAWTGMAAAPNGDIYACIYNDNIYKQTGGAGDFVTLSQTVRAWGSMAAAPNGDIYAAVYNSDIYKQTGGSGNFIALSETARLWYTMAAAPNGNVYAAVYNGDIYKQGPPAAPTLLTATCSTGIGESTLPDAPGTAFTADVYSGLAPLTVQFTDRSSGTPTSWLWEFGDGTTSTAQNPSKIFAVGTHTVRLTATNAQGPGVPYQATIMATTTPVVTPPADGTVIPVEGPPGSTIDSIYGKIAYYAVDRAGNQVHIYGQTGSLLKTFGGVGTAIGKFYLPTTCSVIGGRQLIDRIVIDEE